jgi:hypothetical protein
VSRNPIRQRNQVIWPDKAAQMKIIALNQAENIVNAGIFITGAQKMEHSHKLDEKRR